MEILKDTLLGELYEKAYQEEYKRAYEEEYKKAYKEAVKQIQEEDSRAFADYLIKGSGGTLTWKEALEKVEKILSRKGSNTPPATS